jgi:hypothetical protein
MTDLFRFGPLLLELVKANQPDAIEHDWVLFAEMFKKLSAEFEASIGSFIPLINEGAVFAEQLGLRHVGDRIDPHHTG